MHHYLKKQSSMTSQEEDRPSEPIQPTIIPKTKKRPNWLKATLEDVEGHGATKGTFGEIKIPKRYSGYATYTKKLINEK